ncbi:MAG: hypothetical protein H6733_06160 [Alphaproteobacteria bacterium]|nr:hypothetical protein [Alphaproteobacteria bacterium]
MKVSRWTGGVVALGLGIVGGGCAVDPRASLDGAHKQGGADGATATPHVEAVWMAPLSGDDAALLVRFDVPPAAGGMVVPPREGGTWVHDDGRGEDAVKGDGLFTGRVALDVAAWRQARRDRQDGARDAIAHRFDGLTVAETAWPERVDVVGPQPLPVGGVRGLVAAEAVFPTSLLPGGPASLSATADPDATLVVTDVNVVQDRTRTGVWTWNGTRCEQTGDPWGPWGFAGLMQGVTGGYVSVDSLVTSWVLTFDQPHTVGSWTIPGSHQGVLTLWDGDPNNTNAIPWGRDWDDGMPGVFNDDLDIGQAPLQLIAIVNRLDLAAAGYDDAGPELRFVFTFLNEEDCSPAPGTIILEYAVPDDCGSVEAFAADWLALDALTTGSASYNAALEAITTPVTDTGAGPGRPNDSRLKVLRTNEQAIRNPEYLSTWPTVASSSWDMQQFGVDPSTHLLVNQLLTQTPAHVWELPDWLSAGPAGPWEEPIDSYIDDWRGDLENGTHVIPEFDPISGLPAQAAWVQYGVFQSAAIVPYLWSDFPAYPTPMWRMLAWGSGARDLANRDARFALSLGSCNGCHHGETFEDGDVPSTVSYDLHWGASTPGGTPEQPFQHIRPDANLANPAHLSRFLTGTDVACDPGLEFVAPLGGLTACASNACCPIGDPVYGYTKQQVHFDEFARRGAILQDVAVDGCSALIGHQLAGTPFLVAH